MTDHTVAHDCLYVGHQVVEGYERQFSFHMGILAQMTTGMARCGMSIAIDEKRRGSDYKPVFCAETLLDTENISQRRKTRFKI